MSSAPNSTPGSASLWEHLVKTALLGSERAPFPRLAEHPEAALSGLSAQIRTDNPEAALLSAAALIATYERCGLLPEAAGVSSLSPASADRLPRCGSGASSYLRRILSGQFLVLLPEFLTALSAAGKRIPEELLPALFEAAKSGAGSQEARKALGPVIGSRGEWLAALNPEWNFVGARIAPEAWETGTRAERLALLRHLRQSNPGQAIALLESTWSSDAPEDRIAFVTELAPGLSLKDEPFLEAALLDRRKEVRQGAAELLMRLPQSALVERMWQRLAPTVRVEKSSGFKLKKLLGKQSLEIELPGACDEAMQRDGVEPKPPQGTGEKAWWLQQMVCAIPPERWEAHLKLSPEHCVDAFKASDFSGELLAAVTDAVKRHKDPRWARPLMEVALAQASADGRVPVPGKPWAGLLEVVAVMAEADRDAVVSRQLDRHGDMADLALALKLLHSSPGPWSLALARSLLNLLRYVIRQMATGKTPPLWSGLGDMRAIACNLPLAMVDEFQQGWHEDATGKTFFRPVEIIIEILQFRSKMHKEISR